MRHPDDEILPSRQEAEPAEEEIRRVFDTKDFVHPGQMRQHRTEAGPKRRRFVRDGEVPVVILSAKQEPVSSMRAAASPRATAEAAERALRAERNAREQTERALRAERNAREQTERRLREVLATVQSLQAKLAHAEMAHGEALAAERQARKQAEQTTRDAIAAREEAERQLSARSSPLIATASARRRTKAAAVPSSQDEPAPIEWWVPGWQNRFYRTGR